MSTITVNHVIRGDVGENNIMLLGLLKFIKIVKKRLGR